MAWPPDASFGCTMETGWHLVGTAAVLLAFTVPGLAAVSMLDVGGDRPPR